MIDFASRRWQRLDTLLAGALEREEHARDAYLREVCGEDHLLYEEARALLADAAEAVRAIGESAAAWAAPLLAVEDPPVDLCPGDRVGPYRIEEELGRGGMGVVYRASRADGAFEKDVALKLVKRGMDTDEVLRRFHRERQVLAGLDHPGIARLLDGGVSDDGRPYLVMEYVGGEPMTDYCDRRGLEIDARLGLFERVCEAVQHAHRRLVVHRDLKPSNVLIAEGEDGEPRPKLLDFGIARLLEPDADGAPTRTAARRLTPAYAAPEQVRGDPVTTAADVYALGVILYELLAGRRPDRPPGPPSDTAALEAAETRSTTPAKLRGRLRGDLDTIALQALREEPEERIPSVESLLDDLRRHRTGLPIHARPASAVYRLRKFVQRHRNGVAVSVGWAAVLIVGGLLYTQGIEREKRVAEGEAERARLLAGVMQELLETADPYTLSAQPGDSLLLVRGRRMVEEDLDGEPDLQIDLLTTLGRVYRERGEYAPAERLLEQALSIARETHHEAHPSVVAVLREIGGLHTDLGAHPEARAFYEEMLAMQRALDGERSPATVVTLSLLAQVEAFAGNMEASERRHREIVDLSRRIHAPTDPAHINAVWKLARVLYMRGKYAESQTALEQFLQLNRERFGDEHPEVAHALQWMGLVLTDRGEFDASEAYLRRALAMQRRLLGPDHGEVATTLFGLGLLANERGDPDVAVGLVERSVEMSRRTLGEEHRDTVFRTHILGDIYRQAGRHAEAVVALDRALSTYREVLGEGHTSVRAVLAAKGRTLSDAGEFGRAASVFREALSIRDREEPPYGRSYHAALAGYGELLTRMGRAEAAEPLLRDAVTALETSKAAEHDPATLHAKAALVTCLTAQGRHQEAEPVLRSVHHVLEDRYGPEDPRTRHFAGSPRLTSRSP